MFWATLLTTLEIVLTPLIFWLPHFANPTIVEKFRRFWAEAFCFEPVHMFWGEL